MKTSIKDLKTKGFVTVPYPKELRQAVEKAEGLWKQFCDLPEEVKQNIPYSNDGAGVGYELKNGEGIKADRKENFDVTLAGREWLIDYAEAVEDSIAREFITSAVALVGLIKPLILDFARQSESAFDIQGFGREVEESEDGFFIRFIHYFPHPRESNEIEIEVPHGPEEIAGAHVDQSGCTPHLFESHPGLQCLTYDGRWIPMPVSSGETVIIPSMQMQLRSEGILRALCHRVIATEETKKIGRYSAVCFVQFKNTAKYDKKGQGRLQEREPGFNYKMPFSEFKKLFK